jgi:hypothetical protein
MRALKTPSLKPVGIDFVKKLGTLPTLREDRQGWIFFLLESFIFKVFYGCSTHREVLNEHRSSKAIKTIVIFFKSFCFG